MRLNQMKPFNIKKFIFINLGTIIMALGLYIFLIPPQLAVGGITGLSMVIKTFFPSINLGFLMLCFNIILFLLGFILIGKEFGGYTIYSSLILSVTIGIFEIILPSEKILINDLFLNLIFGILIQGIGMAIIFYNNASTGGTDIIAKIINKYIKIEIGKALILSDSIITLLAGLTFGLELGLYAFLGVLINGFVIDVVIEKFDTKIYTSIITNEYEQISTYIKNDLNRGVTYLNAIGGYSNDTRLIINTVLTKKEYNKLKNILSDIDKDAFVVVNLAHEVLGNGFILNSK